MSEISESAAGTAQGFMLNPNLDRAASYDGELRAILSGAAARTARATIAAWSGYAPTPLHDLAAIADGLDLGQVLYKDEGHRFGLKSFKALGGAYAVDRLVAARGAAGLTVACATDGNHGRSVAWGARRAGVAAVIYVHETVSEGRSEAIRAYGATVVREGRIYDDSVRACTEAAARNGWQIVSDTSWSGYEDVPKDVMQGYALLAMEATEQGAHPTHVFVQGGVGGLAAGILSVAWEQQGAARPIFVVVEPENAACLFESARAGKATAVGGDLDTIMAGLACGEPSILAWRLLQAGADAFMTIADTAAADAMRELASLGVVGGESGVAGLAGLMRAAREPGLRNALRLDASSRVLCYGTEGATDPDVYRSIVGRSAEEVEQ